MIVRSGKLWWEVGIMSFNAQPQTGEHKLPAGIEPRMLSFDIYGTLINTAPSNFKAFESILCDCSAENIDPMEFYSFWEQRNVAHYLEPYRSYKEICRLSLSEAFHHFGVSSGHESLIDRYFECFASMQLYPDALPALNTLARNYQLALVSNIDDDLLNATTLGREFDLICTAEKAQGYKPDGRLFRYLIQKSSLPVSQILHSGQSQFTDMVGGKPLGLTIAWINRRNLELSPKVPHPDFIFPGLAPLCDLLKSV
jgi:2-haloacid dehalogenase